jgi:hypothetical protein
VRGRFQLAARRIYLESYDAARIAVRDEEPASCGIHRDRVEILVGRVDRCAERRQCTGRGVDAKRADGSRVVRDVSHGCRTRRFVGACHSERAAEG